MKKLKNLFVALAMCAPLMAAAQGIAINEENFPDENFRNYLLEQSYGKDGVITEEEIEGITEIKIQKSVFADWIDKVKNLKGIEYFTSLTSLSIPYNAVSNLDISRNQALVYLNCEGNAMESLDVSLNLALESLDVAANYLRSLDVSRHVALRYLNCAQNELQFLDVSQNVALKTLYCDKNELQSLDVSQNVALETLDCSTNQLMSLNVSNNTVLRYLDCYRNQIAGEAMTSLVNSLPQNETKSSLYIYHEEEDGNICTKAQVAVAKDKGWTPYYYDTTEKEWKEYEGCDESASITLPKLKNGTAIIYTLHGQKVTSPVRGGIYILNGKKVVVR